MSELKLFVNAAEVAATYTLTYGGENVYTTERRGVGESITYLTLLIRSLEDVDLRLYDSEGALLTQARFEPATQQLWAAEAEN